jgi:hypothetical protein
MSDFKALHVESWTRADLVCMHVHICHTVALLNSEPLHPVASRGRGGLEETMCTEERVGAWEA